MQEGDRRHDEETAGEAGRGNADERMQHAGRGNGEAQQHRSHPGDAGLREGRPHPVARQTAGEQAAGTNSQPEGGLQPADRRLAQIQDMAAAKQDVELQHRAQSPEQRHGEYREPKRRFRPQHAQSGDQRTATWRRGCARGRCAGGHTPGGDHADQGNGDHWQRHEIQPVLRELVQSAAEPGAQQDRPAYMLISPRPLARDRFRSATMSGRIP